MTGTLPSPGEPRERGPSSSSRPAARCRSCPSPYRRANGAPRRIPWGSRGSRASRTASFDGRARGSRPRLSTNASTRSGRRSRWTSGTAPEPSAGPSSRAPSAPSPISWSTSSGSPVWRRANSVSSNERRSRSSSTLATTIESSPSAGFVRNCSRDTPTEDR